jgi:hypothetical protein
MLLVPFHIGLVALSARRVRAAVVAACLSLAVTFTFESYSAARDLARLVGEPAVLGFLATVAVLLGVRVLRARLASAIASLDRSLQQRRVRLASLPIPVRVRAAMKAAVVYVSAVVWIACVLTGYGIPPPTRVLTPLVFPLLFLAADSTEHLSGRALIALSTVGFLALVSFPLSPLALRVWGGFLVAFSAFVTAAWVIQRRAALFGPEVSSATPSTLTVVLAIVALVASLTGIAIPIERHSMPVAAAETLVHGLYKSGFTFPELLGSLQLPLVGKQLPLLAAMDPKLFGEPEHAAVTTWSLLSFMVEPSVVPRTAGVELTFPVDQSQSAMVVRAPSYLDRAHLRVCRPATCGGELAPERCTGRNTEAPLRHQWPFLDVPSADECTVFSIPVHTPGSHVPHVVRIVDHVYAGLRIRRVNGVTFTGDLPGAEVRLADDHESTGSIEIEVGPAGFLADSFRPGEPALIEVTADNEQLLEPLRKNHMAVWW